jgi:hypothetical protein
MRISKNQLKQIIKEELAGVLREDELSTAPRKMPPTAVGSIEDAIEYMSDWEATRQKYHDDPSTRPQGIAKYIAKGGHAWGKAAGGIESAVRTLGSIPNAIADGIEILQRSTLGGYQGTREGDARDMANRRLESGEWTEEQADQFVDTISRDLIFDPMDLNPDPPVLFPGIPGDKARRDK